MLARSGLRFFLGINHTNSTSFAMNQDNRGYSKTHRVKTPSHRKNLVVLRYMGIFKALNRIYEKGEIRLFPHSACHTRGFL